MRLRLYSCKNSQASLFLHSPRSQCLQTVDWRCCSRGCADTCLGAWKFCGAGSVCRRGQCKGPNGHPEAVRARRQIWSSEKGEKSAITRVCECFIRTFVELESDSVFHKVLSCQIHLVKLRSDDIAQSGRSCQQICLHCVYYAGDVMVGCKEHRRAHEKVHPLVLCHMILQGLSRTDQTDSSLSSLRVHLCHFEIQ